MSPQPSAGPASFPAGFDLEARIVRRAAACGIELGAAAVTMLALHARAVLRANDELHLTTIVEPEEFIERHLGEAFEGAALVSVDSRGTVVDLGSGNGYPGLPFALSRPGLELTLVEASVRKARFLATVIRDADLARAEVLEAHVQRAADLESCGAIDLLTARAVGGWAKIVPKLVSSLAPGGQILLWAGDAVESVLGRVAWRKLRVIDRRALPGRERSWVWRFAAAAAS